MSVRTSVSILAMAALLSMPGFRAADAAGAGLLAQAASPLDIPETPSPTPLPGAPATPPAADTPPSPVQPPPVTMPDESEAPPTPVAPDEEESTIEEELSLGEIPIVETMELTPEIAKRALDSYLAAREKYESSSLEQFENLQDFVDQTEDGKKFDADVKAAGFANVSDWNLAVTTLSLTYGSIIDDQTSDLELQIKEVEADPDMAQDIKDRMVKALRALIPSATNRKVVQDMIADPVYGEKLKLLDTEEE